MGGPPVVDQTLFFPDTVFPSNPRKVDKEDSLLTKPSSYVVAVFCYLVSLRG